MATVELHPARGSSTAASVALLAAAAPQRSLRAGEPLVLQGDPSVGVCFLHSGFLKAYRSLSSGSSQTLALYTPHDIIGAQGQVVGIEAATIAAVTPAVVSCISRSRLKALMVSEPQVVQLLWRATAREAAILQEWIIGMGRRTALSQIAHLLCEIAVRMDLTRYPPQTACDFPLSQVELADAVGLSPVHVNRILQQLRSEGLVQLGRGLLQILDWQRLVKVADFDPAYLGLTTDGDADAPLFLRSRHAFAVGD